MVKGNEVYAIEIQEGGRTRYIPCFTCGHCTRPVKINAERERPHDSCSRCRRWLCGRELCMIDCTPTYALADGNFEDSSKWAKYSKAIQTGVSTLAEAEERKLILPF